MQIEIQKHLSGAYEAYFADHAPSHKCGIARTPEMAVARLFGHAIKSGFDFSSIPISGLNIKRLDRTTVEDLDDLESIANGHVTKEDLDAVNFKVHQQPSRLKPQNLNADSSQAVDIAIIKKAREILSKQPVPKEGRMFYCMHCDTTCKTGQACKCEPVQPPHATGGVVKTAPTSFISNALPTYNPWPKAIAKGVIAARESETLQGLHPPILVDAIKKKIVERVALEVFNKTIATPHISQSKVTCYLCRKEFVNQKYLDKHKCEALEMK